MELVSKSIHREWIVNVGQRSARQRIAHLLCEMYLRLESVGLTDGFACDLPLTQNDIAETTGLTAVHVNRTLQDLRRQGLIVLERQRLTIPDMLALQGAGLFNRTTSIFDVSIATRTAADRRRRHEMGEQAETLAAAAMWRAATGGDQGNEAVELKLSEAQS